MPEDSCDALAHAGTACSAAFAKLSAQLADVQTAVLALLDLFGALSKQLDAQSSEDDPVTGAEEAARTLIEALTADADEEYLRSLALTRETLEEFSREARSLRAYASLTRLTAASLHVEGLEDYVVEVNQIAEDINEHAKAVSNCVDVIGRERGPAINAQQVAEKDLRAMLENLAPARTIQLCLVDEEFAFRSDLAGRVEWLSKGGLTEISSLISIVQFADQFAQRLEHIETILQSDAAREPVTVLAAAQEAALVADAEEICSAAVAALDRLGSIADRSNLITGEDIAASPLGRLLQTHRSTLDCVQRCNDSTATSLAAAALAAGQIVSAIDGAKQKFASLRISAENVGIAALNALLLPGRTGQARLPLGVLATAVQSSSTAFRDKTAIASETMTRLSDGFGPDTIASLKEGLAGFDASVRLCSTRIETADETARAIGELLSQISHAIETVKNAVLDSRAVMHNVLLALHTLRDSSVHKPCGTIDPLPLEPFLAIYTMKREREVHAAVTGIVIDEPVLTGCEDVELF